MHDDAFEARLTGLLQARAATASRPFDSAAIARAAVTSQPRMLRWRGLALPRTGGWLPIVVAAALLVAALAIVAGSHPRPPILVIGDEHGLWFDAQDGSARRQIRSDGPYFTPRWSPDGRYVAVGALTPRDANDFLVFDVAGNPVTDRVGVFDWAWSPAGNQLATLGPTADQLVILDVDGRSAMTLATPATATTIRSFSWSPDGSAILVAADAGGDAPSATLWIMPLNGAPRQFSPEQPMSWPAWSPDGSRIAAVWTRCPEEGCERQIRWYDAVQGGRRGEIQHMEGPWDLHWSPDGSRLAYDELVDGHRDIFSFDPVTLDVVRLETDPANDSLLGWNPDGRSVLAMRSAGDQGIEIWALDIVTGAGVQIATNTYGAAIQPLQR